MYCSEAGLTKKPTKKQKNIHNIQKRMQFKTGMMMMIYQFEL